MKYFTDTAVRAATVAGSALVSNFRQQHARVRGAHILSVSNRSYSKEIAACNDQDAESVIISLISDACPTHNILTEEAGFVDKGSAYTWIIDPLDGSRNFLNHDPFFAVSICLVHNNEPLTGVILSPFLEEMIVARKGHGCTLNGRRVKVSTTPELSQTYIVGCPGGESNNGRFAAMEYALHHQIRDFRKMGSAAVECYMVASGRVDGSASLSISSWDVAAGVLAVQEAGGTVTDFNGNPYTLGNTDLLVSNGLVHEAILHELRRAGVTSTTPLPEFMEAAR